MDDVVLFDACMSESKQYNLLMKQAVSPSEMQIIKWFNKTLSISIQPLSRLQDLKDGSYYLLIISKLYPHTIDPARIIAKPSSLWEIFMNYELLARIFKKEQLVFAIDIQELAHPNVNKHYCLSIFLFDLYNKILSSPQKPNKQAQVNSPRTRHKLLAKKSAIFQHTPLSQQKSLTLRAKPQRQDGWRADSPQQTNFILMNLITAKNLNESYFNIYKISQSSKLNFYSYLRHTTLEFLKGIDLGQEKSKIIDKCLSVRKSFQSIACLFQTANQETTQSYRLAQLNIRFHCTRYYKSIEFLRTIIQNDLRKMKFKRMCIAYLPKIELLPESNWERKQFESTDKQKLVVYFESKVTLDEQATTQQDSISHLKLQQSTIDQEANEAKYDDETQFSDELNDSSDLFLQQSDRPYWTIHRITLIAYELRYVHKKDPNFLEDDQFFYKRSQHTKFVTGFLFSFLKGHRDIDIASLAQASTYPHLAKLLNKKAKHSYGVTQLAEFVRIMLFLKHSSALPLFLATYEAIIAEIQGVSFASVKHERERFAIIEIITEKLAANAASIHQMLKQTLSLKNTESNADSLIRATIYCFLAERFGFHINQFWPAAFPAWEKDKTTKGQKKKVQEENRTD